MAGGVIGEFTRSFLWVMWPMELWSPFEGPSTNMKFLTKRGWLVGGFNPIEKYARQIGSFPQVGMNIKDIWNHHLDEHWSAETTPVTTQFLE